MATSRRIHNWSARSGLALLLFATASGGSAQAPPRGAVGTLLVAHGADREWNAPVESLTTAVATGGPVRIAYLMGPGAVTHRFADVAAELEGLGVREIVVVPLLVSSHSEHYRQILWLAGLTDSVDARLSEHMNHAGQRPVSLRVPIRVTNALDDAIELAEVLADRATALADRPNERGLFLVAHGPTSAEDYAHWMANLRRVAARVRERTGFRDVRVDAVRDDAPAHVRTEAVRRVRELIAMQRTITQRPVIVVPVLISRGRVSRSTLVSDLNGLPIVYAGDPVLPHPALLRWVESTVAAQAKAATPAR